MSTENDQELLRDRRATPGAAPIPPDLVTGGNLAMVGTVVTPDAEITADGVFAVAQLRVSGEEKITAAGVISPYVAPVFTPVSGPDTKVANLGPRLPRHGTKVIADAVNFGWVYQEPGCGPCELRADTSYVVTLPYAGVSATLNLVTGTDTLLAQSGLPGAPHARDGMVWRSSCFRMPVYAADVDNHFHWGSEPCSYGVRFFGYSPYAYRVWTWSDFVLELFCNGANTQFLAYQYVHEVLQSTQDVPDNCTRPTEPASSCAGGLDFSFRSVLGSFGALFFSAGVYVRWDAEWAPQFRLMIGPSSCSPFYLPHKYRFLLEADGTGVDYDVVITEAP